jgi:hypothetical protein
MPPIFEPSELSARATIRAKIADKEMSLEVSNETVFRRFGRVIVEPIIVKIDPDIEDLIPKILNKQCWIGL